jgi:ubiquinone/menaquinone biosynthesis C-methylase UbiE
MDNKKFNKEYNKYWKERVLSSNDGSKVPSSSIYGSIIEKIGIKKSDKILDLGCGDGRHFSELNKYSNLIYGIDIDLSMIEDATIYDYCSLHSASAEKTSFPSNYFDKTIALGVFDVVEQEQGLFEINRILKVGGICAFTGKNTDYFDNDNMAFVAERNAKLKDFPNHFTDINKLVSDIDQYGFSIKELYVCEKRGDFGEGKLIKISQTKCSKFYEYFIILKKEQSLTNLPVTKFAYEYSNTAIKKYKNSNEKDILVFFKNNKNEDK